jgi:hypothetical protein
MPFQPGRSGNPKGRPQGSRNKASLMVDALLFKNMKGIADVLVREALAGQHWAVTLALKDMLPTRSRKVDDPIERPAVATVEDAAQRIAETLSRMEAGALDLDEAQALIAAAQAFASAKSVSDLEKRLDGVLTELAALKAELKGTP